MIRVLMGIGFVLSSTLAWGGSLGDVADNLYEPVAVVNMMIEWACYVVGIALMIGSILQYRIHRQNPKLTPLFTPILMLLIGIVIVLIPHFSVLPKESWSPKLPENNGNASAPRSLNEPLGDSGSHWSSDPRYKP